MRHCGVKMGLRETINQKKSVSVGIAASLFAVAIAFLVYTKWPQRIPKGDKAYYTSDDGQTWFVDSIYKTPPYDQDGKTVVRALVFTYSNGGKSFCPIVERYNASIKKQLDNSIAQATRDGKPLSSIGLFNSPGTAFQMEVKLTGSGHEWVSRGNIPAATKVFSDPQAEAPDGSTVDMAIP
jgi:hypothetical protein